MVQNNSDSSMTDCPECQKKISEIGALVSKVSDLESLMEKMSSNEQPINDQKQLVKQLSMDYADLQRLLEDEKETR